MLRVGQRACGLGEGLRFMNNSTHPQLSFFSSHTWTYLLTNEVTRPIKLNWPTIDSYPQMLRRSMAN